MNKVILTGRLTKNPEVRYTKNTNTCKASFSLAVERKKSGNDEQKADFVNCIAWGKLGEFTEKYLLKGIKIELVGRIETGSYEDKDGKKVYTTDIIAEELGFCESKKSSEENVKENKGETFMKIPDGIDEELPFN